MNRLISYTSLASLLQSVRMVGGCSIIVLTLASSPLSLLHADSHNMAEESEALVIEDEGETEELVIEEESGVDEPEAIADEDSLVIEEDESLTIEESEAISTEDTELAKEQPSDEPVSAESERRVEAESTVKVDEIWAEYAGIPDSNSRASGQLYVHSQATANWRPSSTWEFQLSGRVDGYEQFGGTELDDVRLDYEESFVRYRNDSIRLTVGAQKIIWGRIDEAPPTDRMSTPDFTRYILDDLEDRRRANPAIRLEAFFDNAKLDMVYLPIFREAELPDTDSIWYPVNRTSGEVIGVKSTAITQALVRSSPIDDSASGSNEGGFGLRFSSQLGDVDYGLTAQKVRQATPYYVYNASRGVLEAKYPRTWVLGGDFGFEALGATWRFEGAWYSDTPVTQVVGGYGTVESIEWGGGVEFFPGDGDARLTLQLTGRNLINPPAVVDRGETYLFNGSFEVPFADNQWQAKARFYVGLDEYDLYLNPGISYTGWEAQELYLEGHYFDGAAGTPGGFHQDNSLLTLGWRVKF